MASKMTERQKELRAKVRRVNAARQKRVERDKQILLMRYEYGDTLEYIASVYGISHQRVAQIINKSKEGGK